MLRAVSRKALSNTDFKLTFDWKASKTENCSELLQLFFLAKAINLLMFVREEVSGSALYNFLRYMSQMGTFV